MDALSTLAGLVLAVLGARVLVDGGTAIAKRFGIPSLVIGATVVAFGTSMPEFTVNLHSAIAGSTDLALGNILGSNVFNIAFIIGVVVLIKPLTVGQDSASKDLPMCLISALALGIAGNQLYLDHINYHELMPSAALLFFCFFGITMYYTYREAVGGPPTSARIRRTSTTATRRWASPPAAPRCTLSVGSSAWSSAAN